MAIVRLVITGHGKREASRDGSFLIPPKVSVLFFTRDNRLLSGGSGKTETSEATGAIGLEDHLLNSVPRPDLVDPFVVERALPFTTIPNYDVIGASSTDPAFSRPTGCYVVGPTGFEEPLLDVPEGTVASISEIIYGIIDIYKSSGRYDTSEFVFYWLCCREGPRNAIMDLPETTPKDSLTLNTRPRDTGLKPSEILEGGPPGSAEAWR